MTKSSIPINGKKLADRWDVETTDILYIMLVHDLDVIDQWNNRVSIEDVLAAFRKNKDTSGYMFSFSQVKDIEDKLAVDGEIPHVDVIRGKDLMARWGMNEAQIHSIMFEFGLDVIDPFGHELELNDIFPLIGDGTLNVLDLLFRLTDINDFESEHPEIIPEQPEKKKPEKKKRPSQIHREKCIEMAVKIWEKNPKITIADMYLKDEINILFNGTVYVESTIRNWIKDYCPNRKPGRRPKKK